MDGAITFLIYLFIAIVWVVGKIMQQNEAKRKVEELKRRREERESRGESEEKPYPPTESRPQSRPKKTMEDELQEFLGRMAGMEPEPETPQPPPPPPPPPPQPKVERRPQPPTPPAKPSISHQLPPGGKAQEEVYAKIKDIEDIAEMESAIEDGSVAKADPLKSVRMLMVDMSRTNMPMQRIRLQTPRVVQTQAERPPLNTTRNVKRAIVGGIILGSPKALQPDPFKNDPGQLS